ncbi:MAG: hypothetical protein IKP74_03370, partial [Clostridia bacterium]|nr:hypothetical protein [Clostridia bacterium]
LYRTETGALRMVWSNFSDDGYVVALAGSDNGRLDGKWSQMGTLYRRGAKEDYVFDGGHAMIFRGFDGKNRIVFHTPNKADRAAGVFEHVTIFELNEENGEPKLGKRCGR